MKWQVWRGCVVGVVASLALIGSAGAGEAHAEVVPGSEPYFEVETRAGAAHAEIVPGSEPYFEVETRAGEAHAEVVPGSEPYFEIETGADEAFATVPPPSERQSGQRTLLLQEKH